MIPARFSYVRPDSVAQAISLLADLGEDAKVLAGGQSLLPMMKLRLATPSTLVDIGRLVETSYIRVDGDHLAIGATTRHADLIRSTVVASEAPLIAYAASLVGDPQIRNRGTLGGSLVHADPAADLPTAVLASGATVVLRGPAGEREVSVDSFFVDLFQTAAQPDELLVEVRLPRVAGQGWGYEKFVRRANDWAIVAVATVGGRIALANMGSTPLRARAAEAALAGGASIADAAARADEDTEPVADMHAQPDYRRHLARLLTRRALTACFSPQ
jgi:aerobic carbon-monoxide dehydrogenase medium subunit